MQAISSTRKVWTYSAQRGSYISTVCALLFLMSGEVSLIAFLIVRFLPIEVVKWLVIGGLVGLYLLIASKFLAPLWTKHHLTGTYLALRYGLDFSASIALEEIASAKPARERVVLPQARYETEKQRLNIAFSERGQVLLRLNNPRTFRLGLTGKVIAEAILFNVDERDALLAAISPDTHAPIPDIELGSDGVGAPANVGMPLVGIRGVGTGGVDIQDTAIRTEHLTRRFDDIVAVNDLNLAVRHGEIYGFLGTNGAGKTTTMKMLVGLLRPHTGRAWIEGHDVWQEPLDARAALGYVADRAWLYERLTGREYLAFLAQLRGIPRREADARIEQLLALLDLRERAGSACGTYSFGMKRKLALAGALVHQPPVLILDEPLNGLDPLSARRLKDLFLELASVGTTIFLSTHDLTTAESICHRVGIIARGRLLVEGSAADLREVASAPDLEAVFLALAAQEEVSV